METIQDLGYSPVFDVKEKFYKIKEEQIGKITLEVHIILRYGMVDLVWIGLDSQRKWRIASWGTYSRRLIDNNYRIKKPIIGTYEDLEEILKITFKMYEDFKSTLTGN